MDNLILDTLGGTETEVLDMPSPVSVPSTPVVPVVPVGSQEGNSGSTGLTTSIEEKALTLLGSGIQAEAVASALGVTASRISQLLSREDFAVKVAALRYENLQSHNVRDGKYDSLEDSLIYKLEKSLPLMIRPDTILKAISIVNSAKRRGQSAPEQASNHQNIVNLVLPAIIANKFITNINNQVTKAGEQELITISSGQLLDNTEATQKDRIAFEEKESQDVHTP